MSYPLVSIIVITYNSSKYVLETLESAKAQTYQNIELIVTDDASQDDTVEICKAWLDENGDRFVRTELVTIDQNSGIPANCNRGLRAAEGEWVKLIAGDDILFKNCIKSFVLNARAHNEFYFFISDLIKFNDSYENYYSFENVNSFDDPLNLLKNLLVFRYPSMGPSAFFNREKLTSIGGFNEEYKYIEDFPISISISSQGYGIKHIKLALVKYRQNQNSVSGSEYFSKTFNDVFYDLGKKVALDKKYYLIFMHLFFKEKRTISYNSKSLFDKFYRLATKIIDYYSWRKLLQKR